MAVLTSEFEKEGISPVASGNYAVELYTSGGYKAASVDMVAPLEVAGKVLAKFDFIEEDGGWVNKDIDATVKILGEDLNEKELERVNQIDVNGLAVYLLGIEDTIVGKLKDSIHGEPNAAIWAQELMEIHINEIDWDLLKLCAAANGVTAPLQEIIIEIGLEDDEV